MKAFSLFTARKRSGQSMVFLVMIVVIILFVVLWNFDLHKILSVKSSSQNSGDAAAMAAARWQAISLNLIGDLNIMHAVALMDSIAGVGDPDAADTITDLQARMCFVGPIVGMMASQQAAKNNGMFNNAEYTAYLMNHVNKIRFDYPDFITEPYPGCLQEYANMLEAVCKSGIAAGPDNMRLYSDYLGDHMLFNRDFYDAIATSAWCWFYLHAYDLLLTYTDYTCWPPLPEVSNPNPINCEFFSLHMAKESRSLDKAALVDLMNDIKDEENLAGTPIVYADVKDVNATWYCFDDQWNEKFAMDGTFPSVGPVKPAYDYVGADSAIRTETTPDTRTPGSRPHKITWSAAAKPFGYLNKDDKPNEYGIVLPAFHNVRLIPVDASSAPWGGSFDLGLRAHVEDHLAGYMASGLSALVPSCWYCSQLATWENPAFRGAGIIWLSSNSDSCIVQGGPGGGDGGGSRRGH